MYYLIVERPRNESGTTNTGQATQSISKAGNKTIIELNVRARTRLHAEQYKLNK